MPPSGTAIEFDHARVRRRRLQLNIVSSTSKPARASVPHALSVGTAVGVGAVGGVGTPDRSGGSPVMVMMKLELPMPLSLTGVLVAGGKGSTVSELPLPTKFTPGPIVTAFGIAAAGDIDKCGVWFVGAHTR